MFTYSILHRTRAIAQRPFPEASAAKAVSVYRSRNLAGAYSAEVASATKAGRAPNQAVGLATHLSSAARVNRQTPPAALDFEAAIRQADRLFQRLANSPIG